MNMNRRSSSPSLLPRPIRERIRFLVFCSITALVTFELARQGVYQDSALLLAADLGDDGHCSSAMSRPSRIGGGTPGFHVFENLWYHDGTYHVFSDEPTEIQARDVVGGALDLHFRPASERPNIGTVNETYCFAGTTALYNDGSSPDTTPTLFEKYYHFAAENLLGTMAALATFDFPPQGPLGWWYRLIGDRSSTIPNPPDRLVLPWTNSWKDGYGINELVVNGVYRSRLQVKEDWEEIIRARSDPDSESKSGSPWIAFEKVVIVDREAFVQSSSSSASSDGWNKLALPVTSRSPSPHFWTPTRRAMMSYVAAPFFERALPGARLGPVPKVVYVDRQASKRRLRHEDHLGLMDTLLSLRDSGRIAFKHAKLEDLSHAEQVTMVSDADIIVGVHGNGLTHLLWMPQGGNVVEFFPPDSFTRDYEVPATAVGHAYHAIRNVTVYLPEHWVVDEPSVESLRAGMDLPLDTDFVASFLGELVDGMAIKTSYL
ncbi:hypothetical protein JCM24511_00228 [Saitozyma sp. JCM 24511]|nr:hypothetical protein JCM24511_00228 [Saitozyma sp. JCM 24511]